MRIQLAFSRRELTFMEASSYSVFLLTIVKNDLIRPRVQSLDLDVAFEASVGERFNYRLFPIVYDELPIPPTCSRSEFPHGNHDKIIVLRLVVLLKGNERRPRA
jgi:hypothetical protein